MSVSLIAIDWGTSSARAYWLDAHGRIERAKSAPLGVQKVAAGDFPAALTALTAADAHHDVPLLACGMIGSRQGWVEAPYRECPADEATIGAALTAVPGTRLSIVPGLVCRDSSGIPDVMRGEETQIFGALAGGAGDPIRVVVLPGTHSKWALVGASRIETFATFLTGELYSVLLEHSILGRLAVSGDDAAAMEAGVRRSLAPDANLSHDLFSARTLRLTDKLAPGAVGDYLSGLLLGAELAAGQRWLQRQRALGECVHLIGDALLCERYRRAFAIAGVNATLDPPDAAARGLWRIAQRAKMVPVAP
ncbi:MAG TPA: 2-dehydro-3-deoxygalactonokinase [Casimicrobiaceae bacterium]|nr:2-dehydro-3-deoxygalactonokinase [Casimicrobiaceae bacterium]